jgi:hypothetical protein
VPLPKPVSGLVIRYSYLWREEHLKGQEEGVKDRPCAIVLAVINEDGEEIVTVLPITHSPPRSGADAIEIPAATKRRLGLDDERSWVVLTEANRFIWPGPDLRPARRGDAASVAFGLLPGALFEQIRTRFAANVRARKAGAVTRSE